MTRIQEIQKKKKKKKKKIEGENKVLKSARKLFYVRENIVDYFKEGIFPYKGDVFKIK